jgi:hypothetical protein
MLCRKLTIGGFNYLRLSYTQVLSATDINYIPEVSGGATETVVVQDLTPVTTGAPRFFRQRITGP